jgi:RNA polymerase sigma factor (sigma-70 family)
MHPVENEPAPGSIVARLFQVYAPAVRAFFVRRLGNLDDAREATQEVFLHLWRQEQSGRLESEAAGYLFRAAENQARDCRRRARTRVMDKHEPLEGHEELTEPAPESAEVVHWQRGLEMVMEAIKELPADTQRIFTLYHGSRMSYTEIAKHLGITPRTVERHMAQALAHCKTRLKAYL